MFLEKSLSKEPLIARSEYFQAFHADAAPDRCYRRPGRLFRADLAWRFRAPFSGPRGCRICCTQSAAPNRKSLFYLHPPAQHLRNNGRAGGPDCCAVFRFCARLGATRGASAQRVAPRSPAGDRSFHAKELPGSIKRMIAPAGDARNRVPHLYRARSTPARASAQQIRVLFRFICVGSPADLWMVVAGTATRKFRRKGRTVV